MGQIFQSEPCRRFVFPPRRWESPSTSRGGNKKYTPLVPAPGGIVYGQSQYFFRQHKQRLCQTRTIDIDFWHRLTEWPSLRATKSRQNRSSLPEPAALSLRWVHLIKHPPPPPPLPQYPPRPTGRVQCSTVGTRHREHNEDKVRPYSGADRLTVIGGCQIH